MNGSGDVSLSPGLYKNCMVTKLFHSWPFPPHLFAVPSVKNLDCALLQSASLQILRRPGECVLLPCSCTDLKATPKSVTWMTTSESQSPDGGWKIVSTTDVSYRGRLETFNHTSPGNLSLGLSDLTQEDHGSYRCLINGQKGGQITLLVLGNPLWGHTMFHNL